MDAPERTPQGFLKVPAHLTRAGVLTYYNADGSERREWRPSSEVLRADSLATLISAPVTDQHPPEPVTVANRDKYDRGNVGENIVRDGGRVAATLYVKDGKLISAIERGDQREVSCGYTCDVEMTPGVVPDGEPDAGQRYDAVQRGIAYNHVAAVARGRAGSDVRMHLDAAGNVVLDAEWSTAQMNELPDSAFLYIEAGGKKDAGGKTTPRSLRHFPVRGPDGKLDLAHLRNAAARIPQSNLAPTIRERLAVEAHRLLEGANSTRGDSIMVKERIDGVDYEVGTDPHTAAVARRDAAEKAAKDERDKLQARIDAAEAENKKLKADVEAMPTKIAEQAKVRADLEQKARAILGSEAKLDGLSDAEIRKQVAAKGNPAVKLDGKSEAYIEALFDRAVAEGAPAADITVVRGDEHERATKNDADAAWEKMTKRELNRWQAKA